MAAILRRLVAKGTIPIPGAPLALVAKLIEREGFEAMYLSGAVLSAGVHAVPDIGLVTLDQLARHTRILSAAAEIPLVVDADTGFGGPREVEECVRVLEAAGAAAIQLEDQQGAASGVGGSKRCGHLPGKQVISKAEMEEKIAAACAARRNPETIIIARTDARGVTDSHGHRGIDDSLARLHGYREAGADWLFPEAPRDRDEFALLGREFAGAAPLLANMTEFGVGPLLSVDELSDLGFAAVLYPVTLMRVAMKAMEAALAVIADEGTQESLLDLMQSREELYDLLEYDPAHPERWLAAHRSAESPLGDAS
ncbi:MAG: methylisocitrate lyase [Planctomycetota bacterium]|nr:MAG: methylisocitrate lyase [Planctomycetota bacterium]